MYPNVPHPDPKGDQLNRVIAPALEWYAAERAKHVKETSKDVNVINTPTVSKAHINNCLLYTSPSPRDKRQSRMPSSA